MSEKDFLSQFSSDGKKPDSFKEEERIKIEKPKKQINPKGIIIAAVIVVALGVLSYFLFFAPKIVMPNFVGQTKDDVASWVKQQGITTSGIVFKEEYNFDNDANIILSQDVKEGKKVKKDVKITFTISLGADPDEKVTIPDLKNMTKSEIESWISENKLTKAKITTSYNDTYDKDTVISYEVKGVDEEDFTRSSTLNISISKGPQPTGTVTVSDFVGKDYSDVETWAKTNKVTVNKVESYSDKVDSGKVISQSIAKNETMKTTDTLTITVSKGKGVKVPNLASMTRKQIESWASKNNINLTTDEQYSDSDKALLSCNISSGQTISSSDEVKITFNLGKYFYADDEDLKDIVGMNAYKLEDWCNEKRHKGIDAYCGNWSESSAVYSDTYEKGKIVSYEISSYSTGETYDINDRLPLDVRFSIVISKGKYYTMKELFTTDKTSTIATVGDIMDALTARGITYTLSSNVGSGDYGKQGRIVGKSPSDDLYDDQSYTIEVCEDGGWYQVEGAKPTSSPTASPESGD